MLDNYSEESGVTRKAFVFTATRLHMLKHVELTSQLVVALIATVVVVFSTMTVPSVVAQTTSSPPIRANSVTSESIKDGEVKTQDLANGAVTTGKIADGTIQAGDIAADVIPSGNTQPTIETVFTDLVLLNEIGSFGFADANCPSGEILTGGGVSVVGNVHVTASIPFDADTWRASAIADASGDLQGVKAWVVCIDFTP